MPAHRAKTERGVLQLPSGRWQYSLRFKGKLYRKTYPTKGIAKAKREKLLTELREGTYFPPKAPTIEDAVKKFLKWSKSSCRPSTQENDRWVAALWLASPALRGRSLDRITAGDVEKFKQEMRERTRPAPKSAGENAPPSRSARGRLTWPWPVSGGCSRSPLPGGWCGRTRRGRCRYSTRIGGGCVSSLTRRN